MNADRRYALFLIGSLLIMVAFGFAWSAPAPVAAQGQSTPTLEPPSPRTPPPGPRGTPTPAPVQPTPGPTSAPQEITPTPTPPVLMPVSGGPARGTGHPVLFLVLLAAGSILVLIGSVSSTHRKTG